MGFYLDNGHEEVNLYAFQFNSADDMDGYTEWLHSCRDKVKRLASAQETQGVVLKDSQVFGYR